MTILKVYHNDKNDQNLNQVEYVTISECFGERYKVGPAECWVTIEEDWQESLSYWPYSSIDSIEFGTIESAIQYVKQNYKEFKEIKK